jgi:GPH family glycoside/pentoside/hexuronide:cation symporter
MSEETNPYSGPETGGTKSPPQSADRIPFVQKSAYAIGMFVNNLQAGALPAMMVILNLGLGMDPVLVGVIGFIPRIFDAVSDPMMGYISDNTRSRWGRRRPYIFAGAILAGLCFAAMWQIPSGYSESFYFWAFLVASVIFFLTYTVYATPFVAFGYEMTPDYHERTRLHAFANTVGQLAWVGLPWFWAIMASDLFTDMAHGARVLALWVGGAIILLGMVPAIFCREIVQTDKLAVKPESEGFAKNTADFFKGLLSSLKCSPFVKLCAATFLVFNGFQLGISFSLYVMIYYVFAGGMDLDGANAAAGGLNGWFGSLTAICTLAVIPLTALISERLGKRKTFMVTIGLSILGYGLKWFGYNPGMPYLLLIACPLVAFGTGSLFTLMGSMISDVCDYDELQSHQRREGVFGAIYWWMVKVGMALAGLLTGILLNVSGFDVELGVEQPESALFWLRIFDVVIPMATSALALAIMATYEITEDKAKSIRAELEQRRGKLGS